MSFQLKTAPSVSKDGSAAVRQYGISPVLSAKPPTAADLQQSAELEAELRSRGLFESDEEGEARETAIGMLNEVLQEWMREESVALGQIEPTCTDAIGKILTFGSFRLGVHGPGADM